MGNIRWRLVTTVLAGLIVVFAQPTESTQRYKWWASEEVKSELDLTDEQSDEIEAVFRKIRPKLRELMERLEGEEDEFAAIMHAIQAEEWEVTLQIDKVESARSALSKTRTLMLYRMHKKLTSKQLDGLHAIWERRSSGSQTATGDPR